MNIVNDCFANSGQSRDCIKNAGGKTEKKPGKHDVTRLAVTFSGTEKDQAGRFIWQLVGVLDTYGSICLIGTNV